MNTADIYNLLMDRSGLSAEVMAMARRDPKFSRIAEALVSIHEGKEVLYGYYIDTHGSDPINFSLMEHFCDVKRKFVRIQTMLKLMLEGKPIAMEEFLDSYADMAVYGMMGVQLIIHHMEKINADGAKAQQSDGPGEHPRHDPPTGRAVHF